MTAALIAAFCCLAAPPAAEAVPRALHDRCLRTLHEAMTEGKEWVKIHAAEAFLWTGYPEGIREPFLRERDCTEPKYRIGVWRVLAQAAPTPQERGIYEQRIFSVFLDTQAPDRCHASETLGKLGFSSHDPEVLRVAGQETGSFKAMTRWVIANSGKEEDEAQLAELLNAENMDERGCAAYAFRFFKTVRPATLARLEAAGKKEAADSPQRANILSPWYRHAPAADRPAIYALLIDCAEHGNKDAKREVCAALGRVPDPKDLPFLIRLLDDPELDARSGAAETILRIENSLKKQ